MADDPHHPPQDAADDVHRVPIEDVLDLHAFSPRDIPSVVEEYVTAAHEAGLREVRLIHGRGKGVQRGIVQQALEHHPLVRAFYDAPESHLGATVAQLKESSEGTLT
jgi:DNA-nicking Smr family endonuclease